MAWAGKIRPGDDVLDADDERVHVVRVDHFKGCFCEDRSRVRKWYRDSDLRLIRPETGKLAKSAGPIS